MINRKRPIARKDGDDSRIKRHKPGMQIVWKRNDTGEKTLQNHEFGLLFHYCAIGGGFRKPFWCALRNFKGSASSVLLRVNCGEAVFEQIREKFTFVNQFFESGLQIRLPIIDRDDFWKKILHVSDGNKEKLKKIIQEHGDPFSYEVPKTEDDLNKLHLLVSLADMAQNSYPIPDTWIVPSKDKYRKVSHESPIFVIDCEMCTVVGGGQAVTRFSLIDELGNTVFDTLVQPEEKIADYLTMYSGITEFMLKGVKTTLKDCHDAIKYLLPDDAILCGHSLNCDLSALKISHPYCIDAALLFSISGGTRKTSLKNLTKLFLKRNIQGSASGHCSVEDCRATLELVNLKFSHGFSYGNVNQGFNTGMLPKEEVIKVQEDDDDDFVQTPLVHADKSVPKYCIVCGDKFAAECNIAGCPCKAGNTSTCLKCMVKEDTLKNKHEHVGDEYFDWVATTKNTELFKSVPIGNYLKKPMSTLLCAIKDPSSYIAETHKFMEICPSTGFASFDEYVKNVGPLCIQHKLSVLEHDVSVSTEEEYTKADETIKHLFDKCVISNSLCSVVFATDKETIAFVKIKDRL